MRGNPSFDIWNLARNDSFFFLANFSCKFFVIHWMFNIQAIALKIVFCFNLLPNFLVLFFVFFSILDKSFNLLFWKSSLIVCNCNFSVLWSTSISSRYIHDTIFIDFKCNLNLWNSSWGWWNTVQVKASKLVIVLSHLSFAFKHLYTHPWLIISISCENLRLFCWDGGISFDQFSHDSTCSFNSQWQRGNIQKYTWINSFVSIAF